MLMKDPDLPAALDVQVLDFPNKSLYRERIVILS